MIHGSHPCAAVEAALRIKGQTWRTSEVVPPTQVVVMRLLGWGAGTVPAIRFADGERVQGSVAIMRRLDARWPDPSLYPPDPVRRAACDDAERWGDGELQTLTRRLLFAGFRRRPDALHSYSEHAKVRFPRAVTRLVAPLVIAGETRLHRITPAKVDRDIEQLPVAFDRIDDWIARGVLGQDDVTAADLQLAGSIRLLLTIEDVRSRFGDRPAAQLARRLISDLDGNQPAGSLGPR